LYSEDHLRDGPVSTELARGRKIKLGDVRANLRRPPNDARGRLLATLEFNFCESSLPSTMDLAFRHKELIRDSLGDLPKEWDLADRVLVWLEPCFKEDVVAWYASIGSKMIEQFQAHQLDRLDETFRDELLHRIAILKSIRRCGESASGSIADLDDCSVHHRAPDR
jgi:hypothetical protein